MKQKRILLPTIDDAKMFVAAATQCDFDIDVYYNRVVIDAKSIMGIFSLDLSKPIDLAIHAGDTDMSEIMEALKPYLV